MYTDSLLQCSKTLDLQSSSIVEASPGNISFYEDMLRSMDDFKKYMGAKKIVTTQKCQKVIGERSVQLKWVSSFLKSQDIYIFENLSIANFELAMTFTEVNDESCGNDLKIFRTRVFERTIYLVDLYQANFQVQKENYQLLGLTALLSSLKCDQIFVSDIYLDRISKLLIERYSFREVTTMEITLTKAARNNFHILTTSDIINFLLKDFESFVKSKNSSISQESISELILCSIKNCRDFQKRCKGYCYDFVTASVSAVICTLEMNLPDFKSSFVKWVFAKQPLKTNLIDFCREDIHLAKMSKIETFEKRDVIHEIIKSGRFEEIIEDSNEIPLSYKQIGQINNDVGLYLNDNVAIN